MQVQKTNYSVKFNIPNFIKNNKLVAKNNSVDLNLNNNPVAVLNKAFLNFKLPEKKSAISFLQNYKADSSINTGWFIIPSKKNNPEKFQENISLLQNILQDEREIEKIQYSCDMQKNDIHIYLKEGKPKLKLTLNNKKVKKVKNLQDEYKIPLSCLDIFKKYCADNNFSLSAFAKSGIKDSEKCKQKIEEIFPDRLENCTPEELFSGMGIQVGKNRQGGLTISEYKSTFLNNSLDDLGIDENKLLKNVVIIKGDADFTQSVFDDAPKLTTIYGNVDCKTCKKLNLSALKVIKGNIDCRYSNTYLNNLKVIGGNANFRRAHVKADNLEFIGGSLDIHKSLIKYFSSLKIVNND